MTTTFYARAKRKNDTTPKLPVVRAYRLECRTNPGKVKRVASVLFEYQMAMKIIQSNQMRAFVQGGERFWNRREPGQFTTELSQWYKRPVQNQIVAGLDSWLELSKAVIRDIIARSNLSDETKTDLWWLNKCGAQYQTSKQTTVPVWEYKDGTRVATKGRRLALPEALVLLRAITKYVRNHIVSMPQLWRSRIMMLDGTVAQVKQSAGVAHDLWVRVSTLDEGYPAWIPLGANRFFNDASGELSNFAQITLSGDGEVKISLVKRCEKA
ncbi:MAG: hypothetical protein M0Z39_09490 [Actinomycetota bacterium]|nr:hypothetical protein [Actinomycetota bacterium]